MFGITCPGEDNVDAWFMPAETISRFRDCRSHSFLEKESKRIIRIDGAGGTKSSVAETGSF